MAKTTKEYTAPKIPDYEDVVTVEEIKEKVQIMQPEQEFLTRTLGEQIAYMAKKYPDDVMVNYTDRKYSRTWKQFNGECEIIARGFMALGLKKGSHISIWATNVPCWLLTFFGTAKMGGVLITVNTSFKSFEIEYQLKQSDTDCLVMIDGFKGTSYIDIMNELVPEIKHCKPGKLKSAKFPRLKSVVYAGEGECPVGMLPWENLYNMGEKFDKDAFENVRDSLDCHEIVNIQYTSGTTGFPKGVMLTHYNILNNGLTIGDGMAFTNEDKLCITVPFFHCFGMVLALMACITHGTSFVPIDIFNPKKVMDALISEKCTAVHGVPTMFIAMLEHPDFDSYDFSNMRTGIMAGSPCPIKTMREVNTKMHMPEVVIVFGQTESSPGATMTSVDDSEEHRCATVGRAFPGVECKIVDPATNKTLSPGEIGEFCARGYNIMRGYYNMPEATAKAIDEDGWLHFGDLATVDEDGYYKITGRIKDMVIRGGENIYPLELEECLYRHTQVRDVQVIGVPSKKYGEEICACVILKEGETRRCSEEDIIEYYRKHVAFFKIPRYVWFMDSFPMTPSGKIQKMILRERAVERFVLQDDAAIETA